MLFSPSSFSRDGFLDYFSGVVARQQEPFRYKKKATGAASHTPLCWAQKMPLLGGVSVDKKSFIQAIFPRLFQDALDDFH